VWPDTFTNHFAPAIGIAAADVLEAAGWRVIVPSQPLCCGLTWISTGQLATARRVLRRTVRALAPHLRRGAKIVGLEPSCTAVFRSDARELMPGDRDVQRLREQTVTLAELLRHHTEGWRPPRIGGQAIAQTHCHQHAIMGCDDDQALLRDAASCFRPSGALRPTPSCWPTGSAAAPRSSRPAPGVPRSTWPRCWLPGCAASPSVRSGLPGDNFIFNACGPRKQAS
jgi:hypothetical protein